MGGGGDSGGVGCGDSGGVLVVRVLYGYCGAVDGNFDVVGECWRNIGVASEVVAYMSEIGNSWFDDGDYLQSLREVDVGDMLFVA